MWTNHIITLSKKSPDRGGKTQNAALQIITGASKPYKRLHGNITCASAKIGYYTMKEIEKSLQQKLFE